MGRLKPLNNTHTKDKKINLTYETINFMCTVSFYLPAPQRAVIEGAIMELQIWLNGLLKGGDK